MSERSVLRFKSASRLEWRSQDGQDEPEQCAHGARLSDSPGDQHGSYFRYTQAVSNRSKAAFYSITSSALESSVGGTVRPSILPVSALMTSSNLLACTTGKSPGFAPLRMRPA